MDEINDFFDFSKEFTRQTVPRGCVSGSVAATAGVPKEKKLDISRDYIGTDYTKHLVEEELNKLNEVWHLRLIFYSIFNIKYCCFL